MSSIVLDLQKLCLDPLVTTTELLRYALLIGSKLGLRPILDWVDQELDGYDLTDVPPYRILSGTLVCYELGSGSWVYANLPLGTEIPRLHTVISISEMEHVVASKKQFLARFPDAISRELTSNKAGAWGLPLRPTSLALVVDPSTIKAILDAVRSRVLRFSLQLEQQGILGDGVSFTLVEKERVKSMSVVTNNFFGDHNQASTASNDGGVQTAQLNSPEAQQTHSSGNETQAENLLDHLKSHALWYVIVGLAGIIGTYLGFSH